jgi:hypothetical protein
MVIIYTIHFGSSTVQREKNRLAHEALDLLE